MSNDERANPYSIAELVPHSGRMSWLDQVIEGDEKSLIASAVIRDDHLLYQSNVGNAGVGAWSGIEYMAQTAAAWSGWQARLNVQTPRMGLLLGTRRYHSTRTVFLVGEQLTVQVEHQGGSAEGVQQFDCSIRIKGDLVASASLTVLVPPQGEQFFT